MEERIKALIKAATTLRPVIFDEEEAKNTFPCITFHFYNESGAVFGAGKANTETAYCQIDFWYKERTEVIKQAISNVKSAIIQESTFTYPERDYIFETDKKMHHTYFTFQLIKKEGE